MQKVYERNNTNTSLCKILPIFSNVWFNDDSLMVYFICLSFILNLDRLFLPIIIKDFFEYKTFLARILRGLHNANDSIKKFYIKFRKA